MGAGSPERVEVGVKLCPKPGCGGCDKMQNAVSRANNSRKALANTGVYAGNSDLGVVYRSDANEAGVGVEYQTYATDRSIVYALQKRCDSNGGGWENYDNGVKTITCGIVEDLVQIEI